jgi:predicted RNase H-like HicB family nuclease
VTSYLFHAEIVREDDGRWSAGVPSLPGCATWGHSRKEALRNLQDAVEAYIRAVERVGGTLPKEATRQVTEEPVIAVTV